MIPSAKPPVAKVEDEVAVEAPIAPERPSSPPAPAAPAPAATPPAQRRDRVARRRSSGDRRRRPRRPPAPTRRRPTSPRRADSAARGPLGWVEPADPVVEPRPKPRSPRTSRRIPAARLGEGADPAAARGELPQGPPDHRPDDPAGAIEPDQRLRADRRRHDRGDRRRPVHRIRPPAPRRFAARPRGRGAPADHPARPAQARRREGSARPLRPRRQATDPRRHRPDRRLQDLPREHTALFSCKGGSLTLHNCTITVAQPAEPPVLADPRRGGDRPSQVRIEKTFVRGDRHADDRVGRGRGRGRGRPLGADRGAGPADHLDGKRRRRATEAPPPPQHPGEPRADPRALDARRARARPRSPSARSTRPSPGSGPTTPVSLISFHDDVGGRGQGLRQLAGGAERFRGWNDWASMGNGARGQGRLARRRCGRPGRRPTRTARSRRTPGPSRPTSTRSSPSR